MGGQVEVSTTRIVVADDVQGIRNLIKLFVADDPQLAVVGEAASGRDALRSVAELDPDVLVLDLSMPDLDGLEVLAALRDLAAPTRVVVFSALDAARMGPAALALGARAYVEKSAEPSELLAAIRAVD